MEWIAMGVATCAGLLGLLLGFLFYARRPETATALAARFPGLHRLLENKYWVDELYDMAIVRPIRVISDSVLWRFIDARVIDGIVNALGALSICQVHHGLPICANQGLE